MIGEAIGYIKSCIRQTLGAAKLAPNEIDYLVVSTSDDKLPLIGTEFGAELLKSLELIQCVPVIISLQQCASSLAALHYATELFANPGVSNVVVVTFDFSLCDANRIQPFALFSDAVASCLVSRGPSAELYLRSYAVKTDFSGLCRRDDFRSRKRVAVGALDQALSICGATAKEIEKNFSTNFYRPIALFNSSITGIHPSRLYIETLPGYAHCGNCDWIINLIHCRQHQGLVPNKLYLAQAYAPGFSACVLLSTD